MYIKKTKPHSQTENFNYLFYLLNSSQATNGFELFPNRLYLCIYFFSDRHEHRRSPSPLDRHRRPSRFSANRSPSFDQQKITFNTSFTSNPPPLSNHFTQGPQIPPPQPSLDIQGSSILGPHPSTAQIPPLISDFNVPQQISFTSTENVNFTSPPQLNTMGPHINPNMAPPTAQIITSTVTQSVNPPTTIPPLVQQPIGIVAPPGSDLVTPPGQIGPANCKCAFLDFNEYIFINIICSKYCSSSPATNPDSNDASVSSAHSFICHYNGGGANCFRPASSAFKCPASSDFTSNSASDYSTGKY